MGCTRNAHLPDQIQSTKTVEGAVDGGMTDAGSPAPGFFKDLADGAMAPEPAFANDLQHELVILWEALLYLVAPC